VAEGDEFELTVPFLDDSIILEFATARRMISVSQGQLPTSLYFSKTFAISPLMSEVGSERRVSS
jgi:hypothetical protein